MTTLKQILIQTYQQRDPCVALRYKEGGLWHEVSWGNLMGRTRQVSEVLVSRNVEDLPPAEACEVGQHLAQDVHRHLFPAEG